MASLVISDPKGEFKRRVRDLANEMAKGARKNGMTIKFRNVDVISTALTLLEQHLKEEGNKHDKTRNDI